MLQTSKPIPVLPEPAPPLKIMPSPKGRSGESEQTPRRPQGPQQKALRRPDYSKPPETEVRTELCRHNVAYSPERALFLCCTRRFAEVRNVSGTFLFVDKFLRSMALMLGNICRVRSTGVLGLNIRFFMIV